MSHYPIFILLAAAFFVTQLRAQQGLQLEQLNSSCEEVELQTVVYFPFGYGETCPPLSDYVLQSVNDTLVVHLYYDASGAWQLYFCVSVDVLNFIAPGNVSVIEGRSYLLWDVDTSDMTSNGFTPFCALDVHENQVSDNLKIYPNPSYGEITIEFSKPISKINRSISVFSATGKKVYSTFISETSSSLDLSHLERGIYFIAIDGAEGKNASKILIY